MLVNFQKTNFILLLLLLVFSIISCNNQAEKETNSIVKGIYLCPMDCENSTSEEPGSCPVCKMDLVKEIEVEEMNANLKHSTESIFKLNAKWTDQNEQEHQLAGYKGKLHLTTMIFTNCDYACPNLIGDLQNIQDDLTTEAKEKLNFILVTMDTDNDTPQKLRKFSSNFELNNDKWHFLVGNKDDTYQFSKLLGVGYKKFENGMYGHSNILSLINESGEIVYQIEGIHADRSELVKLINKLASNL